MLDFRIVIFSTACIEWELRRQAVHVERNIEARTRSYWWRRKAVRITCSECVFLALGIQHAKRMRRIVLWSVACLALPCFFRIIS